jgi:replicative DNA helicase
MIERNIIIGLLTSTDYLQQIRSIWDIKLIGSVSAKRLASWAWEYFDKFNKAPGRDIEGIFFEKTKSSRFPKDQIEDIEEILSGLSEEFEKTSFNLEYLIDQTQKYLRERRLILHKTTIEGLIAEEKLDEAEQLACEYKPISGGSDTSIDLSNKNILEKIENAFNSTSQSIFKFPGVLGDFINAQLVHGSLIALLARDKMGKTFLLLEFAMRACKRGVSVAFFQAGDMTELQQLKRICIYLAKKSNLKKYCQKHWQPVCDCIWNQLNTCDKPERECDFGIFPGKTKEYLQKEITIQELINIYPDNEDYTPCHSCENFNQNSWGAVWITSIEEIEPLNSEEAKRIISNFFIKNKRKFKLSTHPNDTLSVKQIRSILAIWEKEDNFIPELILIDYADLLTTDGNLEERHKVNKIWKDLRRLSQEKNQPLVIVPTQADAKSYEQSRLKIGNFSEDKRKNAHVTAMYGLNQDPKDREKGLKIMRINEIVIREGEFSSLNEVTILQNLQRGRPFLGSYW